MTLWAMNQSQTLIEDGRHYLPPSNKAKYLSPFKVSPQRLPPSAASLPKSNCHLTLRSDSFRHVALLNALFIQKPQQVGSTRLLTGKSPKQLMNRCLAVTGWFQLQPTLKASYSDWPFVENFPLMRQWVLVSQEFVRILILGSLRGHDLC